MKTKNKTQNRAVTLIELLIVIAIIGILAALTIVVVDKALKRSKRLIYHTTNVQNHKINMFSKPSESYDDPIERRRHMQIEEDLLTWRYQTYKIKK